MKYCAFVVFSFFALSAIFGSVVNASPSPNKGNSIRNRREIPEECRPRHMHHPHHHRVPSDQQWTGEKPGPPPPPPPPPMCCEIPEVLQSHEVMGKCHRFVHETLRSRQKSHRHGGLTPEQEPLRMRYRREADEGEDNSSSKEDTQVDKFQERKECFMSCVFNASGYILPDDMLNEELLNQKLTESVANNTKWAPIVDSAFKKCIAAAKEANSQSQKTCKAGPHEYVKCMMREMLFNCPSDIWNNSPECAEMKDRLEKCPNLAPPPNHRPHHHHHHHHHHKKHRNHYMEDKY